ncbi:MAG: hypothetical protein ABJO36_06870 [Litorimonas sp.]
MFRTGVTSVLSAIFMASAAMAPVNAQEETRQFSSQSGGIVNEALALAAGGETQASIDILQGIVREPGLSAYERSMIYQMLGQYYFEMDRAVDAQDNFEKSVSAGGLLPKEAENLKVVIAQLMIGNGQYREGALRLEEYLENDGQQKPQYIDLLVNAWIQAEDYQRALPWAEKWFNAANPKERKHFDLMNFLYNNLGQAGRQADIVKQMIERWPEDKTLLGTWASMLANGGREQDAFEVTKIMYLNGMLTTETELLKVVQYYSFYDMPYQAAQILELEMEANRISKSPEQLKQLSGLYRQAREYKRAIPILEAAAGLSGDAATFAELGEALYNEGACAKSELAFTEAMNRGYDAGKSWMLIATCRYDQTNTLDRLNCGMTDAEMSGAPITKAREAAISAFNSVPESSRERGNAKKWVQFIEAENQAVRERCDIDHNHIVELCYVKIKRAYDEAIFTKGFKLEDKSCEKYVAEYDAKYRQGASSE